MDTKTRVEKIVEFLERNKENHPQAIRDWIMIQFYEAVWEAIEWKTKGYILCLPEEIKQLKLNAFATAIEKAADIVNETGKGGYSEGEPLRRIIAEHIRNMEPDK